MESLIEMETEGGVLHGALPWLIEIFEILAAVIDIAAIVLLLIGAARFLTGVVIAEVGKSGPERVRRTNRERIELGRYILAGLELFIVSDIIHTALSLALADLVFLGLLVINPLVAATERQFEILMSRYQTGENRTLSVSGEGLWLRQGSQFGQTVIRAARANSDGTSLFEASFFVFDPEGQAQSPFRGPRSAPPG